MVVITGHSQTKFFKNLTLNGNITVFSQSGCKLEDLLLQPEIKAAIQEASVSTLEMFYYTPSFLWLVNVFMHVFFFYFMTVNLVRYCQLRLGPFT